MVRANRPFCVTGISCPEGCLSCEPKSTPATVHILPVTFTAGNAAGKVERQLKIATDLGEGAVPTVTVQAVVEPAEAGATQTSTQTSALPAVGQSASLPAAR